MRSCSVLTCIVDFVVPQIIVVCRDIPPKSVPSPALAPSNTVLLQQARHCLLFVALQLQTTHQDQPNHALFMHICNNMSNKLQLLP
eukprot:m.12454 g.12454  ORF g.12454 m.12454 type:complete len:86 (+) comp5826_c0_seq2:2628-2885(+)